MNYFLTCLVLFLVQSKVTEITRLQEPDQNASTKAIQARYLSPEQTLQQRTLRNRLATIQAELEEAEKSAMLLKAKIANRDRGRVNSRIKPPTVENTRNAFAYVTQAIEKKEAEIDYLGEKVRRLVRNSIERSEAGSMDLVPASPSGLVRLVVGTPNRNRGLQVSAGFGAGAVAVADVLANEEAREEILARKEVGAKLRAAMKLAGTRVTRA